MRFLTWLTQSLILIAPAAALAAPQASESGFAVYCRDRVSKPIHVLIFETTSSRPEFGWCASGEGHFKLYREGRLILMAPTEWDSCSKVGARAKVQVSGFNLSYAEFGGHDRNAGSGSVILPNGETIQTSCAELPRSTR